VLGGRAFQAGSLQLLKIIKTLKKLCFIVNVDWFFDSHRRPLEQRLSLTYETSVIAGYSGIQTDYEIETFAVNSRVPTLRGIYQLYHKVKMLDRDTILIIVSPVMIILCHFLLRTRTKVIYNFSGLGFLRSKSVIVRNLVMWTLKAYPVSGSRVFVLQNTDDYNYLDHLFGSKNNFHLELIAGSGYEVLINNLDAPKTQEVTLGYVGRIRKDKGVLDLLKSVSELQELNYKINLCIWGKLDDESRHGFSKEELAELKGYGRFLRGYSENKVEIFSSFNWFCLPSNGEGLSKAAIEASSFGLPLVLSNVQGNRDMIQGNGFLFEFGNQKNLKDVLLDILKLSPEEYKTMSEISKKMFQKNWTMDSVYHKWNEILIKYDTTSS
jgi:glycosyltransferase involved in cell wall biosynthesis